MFQARSNPKRDHDGGDSHEGRWAGCGHEGPSGVSLGAALADPPVPATPGSDGQVPLPLDGRLSNQVHCLASCGPPGGQADVGVRVPKTA